MKFVTDPNRFSPALSRTNSACNKHLPVLETIQESSPNAKEDVSTGKPVPLTKGIPNAVFADIQKRRKSGSAPIAIAAAKASPSKREEPKANIINEPKKIPFSIKEAIEKRRVSLPGASAAMAVEEVISAVKPPTTTPRKSLVSSTKAEDASVAGAVKKMSTPLRRAINARLEAENMSSPSPQKEESSGSSAIIQAVTPHEKKTMKIPTPLRMSIAALRRKSLPAARPESAKKSTPAAAAAEPEKSRLALPTPVREQIRAARMSISYSEVVPSARRQSLSPQRRTSTGRLLFEQLPFLASSPGIVGNCPSVAKARKSLRQSLSDANATPMEKTAPAEELFQEDCMVAASVQISALATVQELSNGVTASEQLIERTVAAILSPSAFPSSERRESEAPASSIKRLQTPAELKALRRASDVSGMSALSAEEINMVEQYSEMLPKSEAVEEQQVQETENFAVALDAYVRGIECAQTLSTAMVDAEEEEVVLKESDKIESIEAVAEDFPCLAKLFILPASFVDATYTGFDEDLVELYAQEIMEAANVDEAVAYGVALDSFLADPVLFRNHIGALAMPHLIYMQHEDKEGTEDLNVTLPEDAMEVDEIVSEGVSSAEVVEEVALNQSIIQNNNDEGDEEICKEDNTTRIAIEFIGTTPASSRYPSRRTTIQASAQKSTVKKSARKSIAFAEVSTPAAPHSVQKALEVEEVKVVASRSRRGSKAVAVAEEVTEPEIESSAVVEEVIQPTPAPSRAASRRTSRAAQSLSLTPAVEPVAAIASSMEDEVVVVAESTAMDVDEESSVLVEQVEDVTPAAVEVQLVIEETVVDEVKPVSEKATKKRGRGGKASKPVVEEVIIVEPVVSAPVVVEIVVEEPIAVSIAMETEEEDEVVVEVILCDK